ncbi:MAG TPA: hypothetical protein VGX94_09525 [Terriglobia bacterium]|nr:hypothetical protein [Terriglobia bacterium]
MVTKQMIDRALALVAEGGGNYEYFFSHLNSPDWIEPLRECGRFSHPPDAVSNEHGLRFPGWPEGEYLNRMASVAPEAVYSALPKKCFESNNHTVHEIILQIAAKLPPPLAAHIARAEAEWVSKQPVLLLLYSEPSAHLINHLAQNGECEAAISLLGQILDVRAPAEQDKQTETLIDGEPFRWPVDPVGRIDPWHNERLILAVSEPLVDFAPDAFLTLVSQELAKGVLIHSNHRSGNEDLSTIWRPHIAHGSHRDLLDILVTNVQSSALLVSRKHRNGYEIVRRVFNEHKWPIFRRLEAYVLSENESVPTDLMSEILLDVSHFDSPTQNPEFNELLGRWIGKVAQQTKSRVLEIIEAGPDLSRYSSYLEQEEANGARPQAERWLRDEWRLRWFTALENALDQPRSAELEKLTEKYGTPQPPYSTGGVAQIGHLSDTTDEALRKLTMPELISYLKSWVPPPTNHPDAPSRAGIGTQLTRWVSDDPSLFSKQLTLFQDEELHPTYLRSILDAFTSSLKEDKEFDAITVVRAIEWVLANTKADAREPFKWEEDPGWSWAYMSSARFLTELFLHPDHISVDRHEEYWPALEGIAQTQSPTADDEREYRKKADFGMMALNTARPVGLEAVIRYARWLKLSKTDVEVSANRLPKVFDLLSRHLDPAVDGSVAVRELFGMQFGVLAWLDRTWLEQQLPALFPGKPFKILDKFAWNSYLRFGNPISETLPAMRFRYERAINALDLKATSVDEADRALGAHLMRYLAAGTIRIDDPLLVLFFSKASQALRAQTVGDVGWELTQDTRQLEAVVQRRLMEFWEARFAAGVAEGANARRELGAFGWWLSSSKFPRDWSVRQAVAVADNFHDLHPDFAVIEWFAELAQAYPYEAVHCLGIIFEEDLEGWAIHGWGDNARIIIREALSGGERSRTEAVRVVNLLVARGHRAYRTLLSG